jgi:hypothetical protein
LVVPKIKGVDSSYIFFGVIKEENTLPNNVKINK